MSSDAAITRAKERFEALRARDAVAIMYSESATELVPLSPTNLPRHFRKFEGMRAFNFHPCKDRRGLLVTHSVCTETERLVIEAFRNVSKDLEEHLEAHGYTTRFRISELDWAIALVEASRRKLLGSEGYDWQWWQDADDDLLITGRIAECWDKNMNIMDRYFVELNNTVESSLRLIEHLATEPGVTKQTDTREKTADQLLQDLYERNPNFACTASLRVLAADLGFASSSALTATYFYSNVLREKRDAVKEIISHRKQAEKRIRAGMPYVDDKETIDAVDKTLGEYFEQIAEEVHRVD